MTFNDFKNVLYQNGFWYSKDFDDRALLPDRIISKTHVIDKAIRVESTNVGKPGEYQKHLIISLEVPHGYDEMHRRITWDTIAHLVYSATENIEEKVTVYEYPGNGPIQVAKVHEVLGTDEISHKLSANLYLHIKEFYDAYNEEAHG